MSKIITSIDVLFNYDDFVSLYKATNFDFSNVLWNVLRDNPNRKHEKNGKLFEINPPLFMNIRDLRFGQMPLFLECIGEVPSSVFEDEELQSQMFSKVTALVEELKTALQKVQIPTENIENCKYIEEDEQFYVKVGYESPHMMTLECEIEEKSYNEVRWNY